MARTPKKVEEEVIGQDDLSTEQEKKIDTPLIYGAMVFIMRDVEAIGKAQQSTGVKFNFRGIDDVMNALHPILAKHGVFVTPLVEAVENKVFVQDVKNNSGQVTGQRNNYWAGLRVRYRFYAADGSSVDCVVCAESSDFSDKATQQALSYCFKAAMLQSFCIPTADTNDGDHKSEPLEGKETKPISTTKQGSRLDDMPKLGERPKSVEAKPGQETSEVKMTTNEAWKSIKDLIVPDLVKDDTHFHWWRIAALRENGLTVPENMGLVPREHGVLLYKIAHASREQGRLLEKLEGSE